MDLPAVSVIFLSYRQERFVEAALLAALAQDLPEFELIVADDASPDGTWAVIERVLAGPVRPGIRVRRLRQPVNLGLLGNFNAALAMATGQVFVLMAGDDLSYPARARRMAEVFASDPTLRAVNCASRDVDAEGAPLAGRSPDLRTRTFEHGVGRQDPFAGAPVIGACAAYHRSLPETFGPLSPDAGGEDIDSLFRALLLGRVQYLGEVLLDYRQHGGNIFNYSTAAIAQAELAKREIRTAEALARCDRPWLRDLARARAAGLVDERRARRVAAIVDKFVGRHQLLALSLQVAPFSAWWPSAGRLLRHGDFMKVCKLLLLRLFESRRQAHWAWLRRRKGQ